VTPAYLKSAGGKLGEKGVARLLPWSWPIYATKGLVGAVKHELTKREQAELRRLLRKSNGWLPHLSKRERTRLANLISKLNPLTVSRFVAAEASPLPWPKPPG